MNRLSKVLLSLPLLATLACNSNSSTAAAPATCKEVGAPVLGENDTVAMVRGQPVLAKELLGKLKTAEIKATAEYLGKVQQAREEALRRLVMERLLEEEAKKQGVATVDEFVKKEVEKAKKPMDDARLKEVYTKLVQPGGPAFEDVKGQVAQMVQQQDMQEVVGALMNRIETEAKVEWKLPVPKLPKLDVSVDDDPILGNKDAKVTIVEFSDFECPFCSHAADAVHEVEKKYAGKVRVVFRDFPLSFHANAKAAAIAANCAKEQDKFWPFHDQLFKNQKALEPTAFKTYARVAGLDGEKFDTCLASNPYAAEVEKDVKDGEALGVEGTPTFFVNGRPVTAGGSVEGLSAAVEAALADPS